MCVVTKLASEYNSKHATPLALTATLRAACGSGVSVHWKDVDVLRSVIDDDFTFAWRDSAACVI